LHASHDRDNYYADFQFNIVKSFINIVRVNAITPAKLKSSTLLRINVELGMFQNQPITLSPLIDSRSSHSFISLTVVRFRSFICQKSVQMTKFHYHGSYWSRRVWRCSFACWNWLLFCRAFQNTTRSEGHAQLCQSFIKHRR